MAQKEKAEGRDKKKMTQKQTRTLQEQQKKNEWMNGTEKKKMNCPGKDEVIDKRKRREQKETFASDQRIGAIKTISLLITFVN